MSRVDSSVGSTLNISIAVTGHVDAGKTSLVRALSTVLSTAALDKAPQSQARGITLDLGFSAFTVPAPSAIASAGYANLQFTLVDCPGHASLIRTVIGGAQIMDAMLLVVDAVKGFQTQTAECLVVGEITTNLLIVALNKTDALPVEGRAEAILKAVSKIKKVLASTKFANAPIIPIAAAPREGGVEVAKSAADTDIAALIDALCAVRKPARDAPGPFLFALDHCFAVKGQGTVLTGTVLAGSIAVGDAIELPALRAVFKVKSLQMFKKPATRASQGDRAGICVTGLDASLLERGLACAPNSVPALPAAIALVKRVRFFKGSAPSDMRVHVTVGHSTVMATVIFFGARELAESEELAATLAAAEALKVTDPAPATATAATAPATAAAGAAAGALARTSARGIPAYTFDAGAAWEWQDMLMGGRGDREGGGGGPVAVAAAVEWQWAVLLFDAPVLAPIGSLVVGARLDSDIHVNACRIAFYGRLSSALPVRARPDDHPLRSLRFFKWKLKVGVVDRVVTESEGRGGGEIEIIGRALFKKETDMNRFCGLFLFTRCGQRGVIEGAFGKSGKFKATFARPGEMDTRAARLVMVGAGAGAEVGWSPYRRGSGLLSTPQ